MEGTKPNRIAYDKPSNKLISFLSKHYGLNSFVPQNNNYVIFRDFFDVSTLNSEPNCSPHPNTPIF